MNIMQDYNINDTEDTLSLSNFLVEPEQLTKPIHGSKSTSSSSSSSLSEQDFVGFFNQEWSNNKTPSENIVFCGKVVSSRNPETTRQTNIFFRSNSDSFRLVRLKSIATSRRLVNSRSYSMTNRSELCTYKKKLMVFMFGSGSSKFPTKVDMSVIKSRQLRQQSTSVDGGKEEGDHGGRSGKKWWRLVDVLGCNGGYEKHI